MRRLIHRYNLHLSRSQPFLMTCPWLRIHSFLSSMSFSPFKPIPTPISLSYPHAYRFLSRSHAVECAGAFWVYEEAYSCTPSEIEGVRVGVLGNMLLFNDQLSEYFHVEFFNAAMVYQHTPHLPPSLFFIQLSTNFSFGQYKVVLPLPRPLSSPFLSFVIPFLSRVSPSWSFDGLACSCCL